MLGQSATGSISGTVADSSGAVIPKAAVVLTDEATKGKRDTASHSAGIFNFPSVYPGSYTLTISADGFRTWEERQIVLTQGGNLSIPNIALLVGTANQEIDVVASGEVIVPTDTGAVTNTLNEHMITELAIQGRDAAELIKIMPGMAATGGGTGRSRSTEPTNVQQLDYSEQYGPHRERARWRAPGWIKWRRPSTRRAKGYVSTRSESSCG